MLYSLRFSSQMSNHQECRPCIALSCHGAEASRDSSKPVTAGDDWSVSASPSFMTSAQYRDSLPRTHMLHADARASPQSRSVAFGGGRFRPSRKLLSQHVFHDIRVSCSAQEIPIATPQHACAQVSACASERERQREGMVSTLYRRRAGHSRGHSNHAESS